MKKQAFAALPFLTLLLLGAGCQPTTQEVETNTSSPQIVEETKKQEVPVDNIQKKEVPPAPIKKQVEASTAVHAGTWFDIAYPTSFTARTANNDEAFFTSADKTVEFFVYSPQWSGDPEAYLSTAPTEIVVSEETKETPASTENEQYGDSITRWVTLKANDGSYHRSFVSMKEQVGTGSDLHKVFGIKYATQAAYDTHRDTYVAFKASLNQYADGRPASDTPTASAQLGTYTHAQSQITFDYPSDWKVETDDAGTITIASPQSSETNFQVLLTLPVPSFDEYEQQYNERIQEGMMSVSGTHPTGNNTQKAKEYAQRGGLYYIVEVGGTYVGIGTERYLNEDQQKDVGIILNSIAS